MHARRGSPTAPPRRGRRSTAPRPGRTRHRRAAGSSDRLCQPGHGNDARPEPADRRTASRTRIGVTVGEARLAQADQGDAHRGRQPPRGGRPDEQQRIRTRRDREARIGREDPRVRVTWSKRQRRYPECRQARPGRRPASVPQDGGRAGRSQWPDPAADPSHAKAEPVEVRPHSRRLQRRSPHRSRRGGRRRLTRASPLATTHEAEAEDPEDAGGEQGHGAEDDARVAVRPFAARHEELQAANRNAPPRYAKTSEMVTLGPNSAAAAERGWAVVGAVTVRGRGPRSRPGADRPFRDRSRPAACQPAMCSVASLMGVGTPSCTEKMTVPAGRYMAVRPTMLGSRSRDVTRRWGRPA